MQREGIDPPSPARYKRAVTLAEGEPFHGACAVRRHALEAKKKAPRTAVAVRGALSVTRLF